jgi:decaprenyl-phosphate phosphoribosyltransferase
VSFCLAASGIYVWNDLRDIDADRLHPTKRFRPIPSGELPLDVARIAGIVLPVLALGTMAVTGRWQAVAVVAVYIALTMSYTLWLKYLAVIDLVAIASGFVLRAAGGAVAVDVPMSRWFVLFVTFGSLFVVAGKRYAELAEVGEGAGTRRTLDMYSLNFLRMMLAICCGAALLSYCVWAFEVEVGTTSDVPWYELSIVPMLTALFRYLLVLDDGTGGAPEEVFWNDRVLQILGAVWAVIFGIAVYAA